MLLRDIHVPAAWAAAGDRVVAGASPALVLGAVDSGKSTLVRYLLGRLVARGGPATLLDGDVGMATVGPPGLVGLTLVLDVDALDARPAPDRARFVGSTTPIGNLLPVVVGHALLIEVARRERLPVVVNSSGLVTGGVAKELQLAIADVVEPKAVIGLEGQGELEHLLAPLERRGLEVIRLSPSPRARAKPRAERTHRRAERFAGYFEPAKLHDLPLGGVALEGTLLGSGRPLGEEEREEVERVLDARALEAEAAGDSLAVVLASPPHDEDIPLLQRALGGRSVHVVEAAQTRGLLLGLLAADGECLGMGLLEAWHGDGLLQLWTPLAPSLLAGCRRVRLGSMRLSRNGEELGFRPRERALGGE